MSVTPSTMLPLGTVAPDFTLLDTVSGKQVSLQESKSAAATVILFICNHCPYVVYINEKLAEIAKAYTAKGIQFIAISANDVANHPADAPDKMTQCAKDNGYVFPYLYDETQEVAKAYQAACTPDFYVFDGDLKCIYRGQFDSARPGNDKPVTGTDLTHALDLALQGAIVPEDQQCPSQGCNIKWKD
ncbi:MAG: thioredoxin family protein [Coxiella sp. (in: Bacteria)]|nr:MAG: thioredoxin family protein [Coxiella sp. (in: g-proteobacteria)]